MAKTRQFKLRGFLRQVDDSLLLEYMKAVGTPITIKNEYKNPDEKRLDIENQYAKISEEKRQEIEMDLLDVEELGCDSGIETILSIADKQRSKIADEITLLENNINQSFYCFLNERELFNDAIALYGVKEQSNKKVRTGLKQISFDDIKGKKTILEERLSALIMLKDGRGRH